MLQFSFTPYMREIISKELRGLPLYFRFSETTTSQIKKQYDAYATYVFPTLLQDISERYLLGNVLRTI